MKNGMLSLVCLLIALTFSSNLYAQQMYSWTDVQGRTLQASFVKLEGDFTYHKNEWAGFSFGSVLF